MRTSHTAAIVTTVALLGSLALAGDLDPQGPPSPTMRTLDDLGALAESNEQLLLELLPETGEVCEIAVCLAGGTCPNGSNAVPHPPSAKFHKGCSKSAAQTKMNNFLAGLCVAGFPCNGTCDDQAEECTSWVSPLSYREICSPATVAGCGPNDSPHVCVAIPVQPNNLTCSCNCAS